VAVLAYSSGHAELLSRCAAGADLMPNDENCILVFGGYGLSNPDIEVYDYFNDIFKIDTKQ